MRSPWAQEYARTPRTYIWGTAPSRLAKEVGALLPPGARVLDLGCGEGRDSVFFASQGCDVTAVDASRAGLRKAERLAREKGVTVRWIPGGMSRVMVDGPFDLIYSCGSIHYVPRRERARLFGRLKALTRPGGRHAHIVFTNRVVYVEKGEVVDHFAPRELAAAYAGWTVVRQADRLISCAQDGRPHRHRVEEFVAMAVGPSQAARD